MGREIKFRAWNDETKTMVDLEKITPLALNDSMNSQLAAQGMGGVFIPFKKGFIIEQWTGLLDSEKKEIYENDVVQALWQWSQKPEIKIVKYWEPSIQFVFADLNQKEGEMLSCSDMEWINISTLKVIGNVHENPEFLRAG